MKNAHPTFNVAGAILGQENNAAYLCNVAGAVLEIGSPSSSLLGMLQPHTTD